jgi:hypothetical protein
VQNEDNSPLPFVETTVARLMLSRMRTTHEERGITVISGPWGIGKPAQSMPSSANSRASALW